MTSRLHTENITKIYARRKVVNGISLEVNEGEIVGLLGPNGAGKTTTFYMVLGLTRPNSGKVFLDEEDITDFPVFVRARKGIGYLPQEASVFTKMTVRDNLMAIYETLGGRHGENLEQADNLLREFGLTELAAQKAYSLSGGERRRVEIARALVMSPSFLLLDEPFAGIDPIAVIDIQKIISKLKQKGIGVLITDHNVRETLSITDRAYIIREGEIFRADSPENLAADPEVRKIYLGENFSLN